MRCFIAIDLPDDVKDYIFSLEKFIGNELAKIKWVAKKNLHLTLKFLGEIDEEKLKLVKEKLKNIKFGKFKVNLDKIGVFPNENYITVVWVGVKDDKNIFELQKAIDSELLSLFSKEQKFQSHLTFGRVKFVKDKTNFLKKIKEIEVKNLPLEIKEFKLYKSELSKDGPKYTVLETYTLS